MRGALLRSFWLLSLLCLATSSFAQTETFATPEQTWRALVATLQTLEQLESRYEQLRTISAQSSTQQAQALADSLTEIESLKTLLQSERDNLTQTLSLLDASRADYATLKTSYDNAMKRIDSLTALVETLERQLSEASTSLASSASNLDSALKTMLWWKVGTVASVIWAVIATILAAVK